MIAVDTNILVYAHREDSPFHDKAAECITGLAEGRASWAIPWPCIHEFFSIITHPRIFNPPSPMDRALTQLDAWFESPTLVMLSESRKHWSILRSMVASAQISGPLIHDARIAVICIQNGVNELFSADRDFGRFPELKTRNPLID
jgi:toxin-antitoxin system PIN domain toxin